MRELVGAAAMVMVAACGPVVELPAGSSGSSGSSTTSVDEGSGRVTTVAMTTTTTGQPMTTTRADTGVLDEGPRLDLPPDFGTDCVDWPFGGCSVPSPAGMVEGSTPLGEFATTMGVFGSDAGCGGICLVSPNILRIYLVADAALVPALEPWGHIDETLVIELDEWGNGGFQGPLGEPVVATLYANRDGVTVQMNAAQVVIDNLPGIEALSEPFDPRAAAIVTGSVTAQAADWSVVGTFAASYCPDVHEFAICE